MISLQECYETGFEDVQNDSKVPSTSELLAWSEQWAYQLQLWGDLEPESFIDNPLDNGISRRTPSLMERFEQEQDIADLHNFYLRSTQDHPHKRKEANLIVNNLLRQVGVPEDDIAQYQEVLPYKIARLHQTMFPQPVVHKIPVWLYKKDINAATFKSASKDLQGLLIEARIRSDELKRQLHAVAKSRLPEHTDWEYILLYGPHTRHSSTNSGVLRRQSDWRDIHSQILSSTNPCHAVIFYQTLDMHRPYQSVPTVDECQERGMSRIKKLIDDAKRTGRKTKHSSLGVTSSQSETSCFTDEDVISSANSLSDSSNLENLKSRKHMSPVSMDDPKPKKQHTSIVSISQINETAVPPHNPKEAIRTPVTRTHLSCPKICDPPYRYNMETAQSKYVTVWLEHDGTVDEYFEYPHCDTLQLKFRRPKGMHKDTWYFQSDVYFG